MPNSNLAAYLAKNYLNASSTSSHHGDEPPKKKRKKTKSSGLVIADDDEGLSLNGAKIVDDDDEDNVPVVSHNGKTHSAEFRKAKKNAWQSLGPNDDADKFLQAAQSDEARRLAEQEAENAPAVVELEESSAPRMESGIRAGLQTAADTARIEAEEQEEAESARRASSKKSKKKKKDEREEGEEEEQEQETVYRDATGRRIDLSLRRAEARAEAQAKDRAAKQDRLDAMGDVQRAQRLQNRQDLDDARFLSLARTVDDDDLNRHQKEQVRWDDPMAAYISSSKQESSSAVVGVRDVDEGGKTKTKTKTPKKAYAGSAAPNRYDIRPGWRWDGVDRGNGFEALWFQARARRGRNEELSYQWQMDE